MGAVSSALEEAARQAGAEIHTRVHITTVDVASRIFEDFSNKHKSAMARDIDDAPVFLAKSSWEIGYVAERFPNVEFSRTRERG